MQVLRGFSRRFRMRLLPRRELTVALPSEAMLARRELRTRLLAAATLCVLRPPRYRLVSWPAAILRRGGHCPGACTRRARALRPLVWLTTATRDRPKPIARRIRSNSRGGMLPPVARGCPCANSPSSSPSGSPRRSASRSMSDAERIAKLTGPGMYPSSAAMTTRGASRPAQRVATRGCTCAGDANRMSTKFPAIRGATRDTRATSAFTSARHSASSSVPAVAPRATASGSRAESSTSSATSGRYRPGRRAALSRATLSLRCVARWRAANGASSGNASTRPRSAVVASSASHATSSSGAIARRSRNVRSPVGATGSHPAELTNTETSGTSRASW